MKYIYKIFLHYLYNFTTRLLRGKFNPLCQDNDLSQTKHNKGMSVWRFRRLCWKRGTSFTLQAGFVGL